MKREYGQICERVLMKCRFLAGETTTTGKVSLRSERKVLVTFPLVSCVSFIHALIWPRTLGFKIFVYCSCSCTCAVLGCFRRLDQVR